MASDEQRLIDQESLDEIVVGKKIEDDTIPTLAIFLSTWIPRLPQHDSIRRDDAEKWYSVVSKGVLGGYMGHSMAWHFNRLAGIGGSEIGEIVAGFRGSKAMFNAADTLWELKLMRRMPVGQTKAMRRGSLAEPMVRDIFLQDYGLEGQGEETIHSAIDRGDIKGLPVWMAATPDDIVEWDGKRVTIDYKTSNEAYTLCPLQYKAQVVQGSLVDRAVNDLDELPGGAIVFLDFNKGSVVPFRLNDDERDQIAVDIVQAGNIFWDYVLSGQYPSGLMIVKEESKSVIMNDKATDVLHDLEVSFMSSKLVFDAAEKQLGDVKTKLTHLLSPYVEERGTAKGLTLPFNVISTGSRSYLDEGKAKELLIANGKNIDDFMMNSVVFDPDLMRQELETRDIKLEPFLLKEFDEELLGIYCQENNLNFPAKSIWYPILRKNSKNIDKELLQEAQTRATIGVTRANNDVSQTSDVDAKIEDDLSESEPG